MGLRGPAPKPSEARLRKNTDYAPITKVSTEDGPVAAPYLPDERWHPTAVAMYEAYQNSPQAHLYVETDWVKIYLMCEAISRELKPQFIGMAEKVEVVEVNGVEVHEIVKTPVQGTIPVKGATLNALNTWMASLLTTEADRRRLSIEISKASEAPKQTPGEAVTAAVIDMFSKKPAGGAS